MLPVPSTLLSPPSSPPTSTTSSSPTPSQIPPTDPTHPQQPHSRPRVRPRRSSGEISRTPSSTPLLPLPPLPAPPVCIPTTDSDSDSDPKLRLQAVERFEGHHGWVRKMIWVDSVGILVSVSEDKSVFLWRWKNRNIDHSTEETEEESSFECIGNFWGGKIGVLACCACEAVQVDSEEEGEDERDDVVLVTGGHDKAIRLWRLRDVLGKNDCVEREREKKKKIDEDEGRSSSSPSPREREQIRPSDAIKAAAEEMARRRREGRRKEIPMLPGQYASRLGHANSVRCIIRLQSDPRILVSSSADKTIRFWKLNEKEEEEIGMASWIFKGHTGTVYCLHEIPERMLLISGSGGADQTIRLWSLRTGNQLAILAGHTHSVRAVVNIVPELCGLQIDHDSRIWLASASWDYSFRLWECQFGEEEDEVEGRCLQSCRDHEMYVIAAKQLRSSRGWMVTGSEDRTMRLWRFRWREDTTPVLDSLGVLEGGHSSYVKTIVELPNGDIVSGSADHTLVLWKKL